MQIVTEDKVLRLGYGYIIWNRAAQCARLSGSSEWYLLALPTRRRGYIIDDLFLGYSVALGPPVKLV